MPPHKHLLAHMTERILVLGSGEVGSAVAHRLFLHGARVVLSDAQAPPHPRRGMAFVDAWFKGAATLDGIMARMTPCLSRLSAASQDIGVIEATCESPTAAAAWLQPDALIDARMCER